MCGIAGILGRREGDNHSSLLRRLHQMTEAIQHRGPDGEGFWVNPSGKTGLGHRRLSIIDLTEAAAQPFHYSHDDTASRYTIIHNGEIYNYIELREELQKEGYKFRTQSDTEVITAAYDYWKEECVDYFDGMFSFAIWDEKEKELFAARDRLGEKPFFYFFDDKEFVFASEIKGLWAAGIKRTPNQRMLFNFITIGYTGNPEQPDETFFEQIKKLPAAASLLYSAERHEIVIEKYWDIDLYTASEKIEDPDAIEKFRKLLQQSAKRRLRSDVPIGSSLSGGLDSSSIVAVVDELKTIYPGSNGKFAAVYGNKAPKAFTAIFPGYEKDESAYSKQVADQFGWQHHTVTVTANDLIDSWGLFSHHQEEPVSSASAFAQYKVFELAKKNSVSVLLDGQGADEILAGYHKYYKWYWQELFHHRKLGRSGEVKSAKELGVNEKFGFPNIVASLFPELASVILERQYLLHAIRQEDLEKDFVRLQSKEAYYSRPAHFSLNGALYFNTCVQGLEELLRYADRNSMAHGREVRLPFLNHELVEFLFTLPSHFKIRNGWTKWLLRKTMDNHLPASISWRRDKVGFEPPQVEWMKHKTMQELVQEGRKKLVEEKILRPAVLEKPIKVLGSHEADNYDWRYFSAATSLYGI